MSIRSPKFIACATLLIASITAFHLVGAEVEKLHAGIPLAKEFEQAREGIRLRPYYLYDEADWLNPRWVGRDVPIPSEITDAAGADKFLSREFVDVRSKNGKDGFAAGSSCGEALNRIGVYVAYSESYARGVNSSALHYPGLCFKGAGWEIVKEDDIEIEVPGYLNGRIAVTEYLFSHPTWKEERLVFYWMQNGERVVESRSSGKLGTFFKTLMGSRIGYLAQVRLDCRLRQGKGKSRNDSVSEARERLTEFARVYLPKSLADYLPGPGQ